MRSSIRLKCQYRISSTDHIVSTDRNAIKGAFKPGSPEILRRVDPNTQGIGDLSRIYPHTGDYQVLTIRWIDSSGNFGFWFLGNAYPTI